MLTAAKNVSNVRASEVSSGQCETPPWERVSAKTTTADPSSSSASGAVLNSLKASSVAQSGGLQSSFNGYPRSLDATCKDLANSAMVGH